MENKVKNKTFNKLKIAKVVYWVIVAGFCIFISIDSYFRFHSTYTHDWFMGWKTLEMISKHSFPNTLAIFAFYWCESAFLYNAIFTKGKRLKSIILYVLLFIPFYITAYVYFH